MSISVGRLSRVVAVRFDSERMSAVGANLPYETDSGIAQTEAKWKLLAASMCFRHRRRPACGQALLTPAIERLGRPRLEHALGPRWIVLESVDRLP
jgi:hypothetical protein